MAPVCDPRPDLEPAKQAETPSRDTAGSASKAPRTQPRARPFTRRFQRREVDLAATLSIDHQSFECHVHNLSPAGARISLASDIPLEVGVAITLTLAGLGEIAGAVQYSEGGFLGLMFEHDADRAEVFDMFFEAKH